MKHYSLALSLDLKHVYQALPRLLSLWFDFTSIKAEKPEASVATSTKEDSHGEYPRSILIFMLNSLTVGNKKASLARCQEEANALMKKNALTISAQAFYTAIPQLVSRISHYDVSIYRCYCL
jgi:hypothetical protein